MATTLSFRPQANATLHERHSSLSSRPHSRNSSTFSNTTSHHKLPSQTSLIPRSPLASTRGSSRPSSSTPQDVVHHRSKRLKSQYPLDSPEPHVEYILVAAFDIDRGPIMEHQYPGAISPDENMLAELMLPDQTHVRTQDWTMFFLHKDAGVEEEEAVEKEARREKRRERKAAYEVAVSNGETEEEEFFSDDTETEDEDDEREGPPLMYVLNLVNTKQDNTVKRSASPLYIYIVVSLIEDRGAVVKAMAICTRHPFLHIYKVRTPLKYQILKADQALATSSSCARGLLQIAISRDLSGAL